jgi:hypothetical protein
LIGRNSRILWIFLAGSMILRVGWPVVSS